MIICDVSLSRYNQVIYNIVYVIGMFIYFNGRLSRRRIITSVIISIVSTHLFHEYSFAAITKATDRVNSVHRPVA